MVKQFTLGKNEKLKSRKQIECLFQEGKKFSVKPLKVVYDYQPAIIEKADTTYLQLGVSVGVHHFKKAVDRNNIKRLLRENWRLQKNELSEKLKSSKLQLNVFLIYNEKTVPAFSMLTAPMAVVLKKLIKLADEKNLAIS